MSKAKEIHPVLPNSRVLVEAMIVLSSGKYVHLSKSRRSNVDWCKISSDSKYISADGTAIIDFKTINLEF